MVPQIPHESPLPQPFSIIVGLLVLVLFIALIVRDLWVNSSEYFPLRFGAGRISYTICMLVFVTLFAGLLVALIWQLA